LDSPSGHTSAAGPRQELDYRRYPVLFVDDEPDILLSLSLTFGGDFTVHTAASGPQGLEVLRGNDVAVVVADQRMPAMTGLEFLSETLSPRPELIRIILTGYTDIAVVVEAINSVGIYRYIAKPWDPDELRLTLRRAIEAYHLEQENVRLLDALRVANERLTSENRYLREREAGEHAPDGMVAESPQMRQLVRLIEKAAPAPTTVLILGETGTGKELVARALHDRSPRAQNLFVPVNCAALSENLLESELFGHKRGAFTDATSDKKGLFEVADGGTLFLDEIGETSPALQAKLLRVLQEGEVVRVGETKPRKVDVRIVAATNRRLEDEMEAGRFRADLYYRLRVVPLYVPPLRERPDDIPALVERFLTKYATRLGKRIAGIAPEALEILGEYPFPGNIRELENEIERAVLFCEPEAQISSSHLSEALTRDDRSRATAFEEAGRSVLKGRTDAFARREIAAALERNAGKKMRAAVDLGITYQGFLKKMRRLGMIE
jgi:two-component system response regulator HupR/HoxA